MFLLRAIRGAHISRIAVRDTKSSRGEKSGSRGAGRRRRAENLAQANGDAYIVGSAPTGAWAGQAGKIAVWSTEIATTDTDTKVPAWEFYAPKEGWLAYVEQDDALMLYNGTAWTFDLKIVGIPQFAGTNTTGAGSASLGANCPAVTPATPYTWIQVKTADGSTAYIPAWK